MRESLIKHTAEMGITIANEQADKLIQYLQLIVKWNRIHNLTAIRDQQDMLPHHLLDSLSVNPWVKAESLLDVGTGAGLPGIPLAILRPELLITLSDSNKKKSSFQQQAQIELGLKNVTVKAGRVEDLSDTEKFDGIISRAFSEMALFTKLTQHLLTDDGRWYAMKGIYPTEELENLPEFVQTEAVYELEVPMLNAQRHLLVMKKK
ncbi:16S rRNA (guanine(527)-N(7))-methyltransferase RsmG [Sulfuriferula nivalis]|uniref:Ribosomal RNA small subunit methyltransferase G n=1 Tax=Sulfuriferula nivalis TaxID=2675298 RepID=A0A809RNY4_9PROT|nr:16S rRNA (guanine(527)-N(7))-methyltransferase RsmG [Sulfuriferula nivalis]BBP02494.1 ribosomal RNA small subunit methyltransferase G [Sulfuriferula nivalis]